MKLAPLLTASVVLFSCGSAAPLPSAPSDKLGVPVGFSLPSDGGLLVTIPLVTAHATVLDFFAPTCTPCRTSVPALVARRDELAARGAKLVLVGVLGDGESTDDAKKALSSWGVSTPFLVDRNDTGRREAGVRLLPATLVLDQVGTLRWVAPTGATAEQVVAAVPCYH